MKDGLRKWISNIMQGLEIRETIIDDFFLKVENNTNYLDTYKGFVTVYGKRNINSKIGRLIKEDYSLLNTGVEIKPVSRLIQSYTKH